ncbi:CocE/NonD family hydrolase [Actinomadura livida]|uniref:CocE/NonD family hydrolase n=1 Tax=Actinomadura livida TaxID=79909 RepID=A0A7W7IK76_9ACTN|nr:MULTISPECIES: CocE/NonD family hydrolase [Actinomadura]MBB4778618.1 putative CocE/NonD family hydrolase [Actinomadura catellatispora]GGU30312.1 peptidase S15 [Actinomadura livida]
MAGALRFADRLLGLPPAPAQRVSVERDLRITMPDGVVLVADLRRPRGAGPLPAVLIRTPYGKERPALRLFAGVLARRGLQVVVQNVRGVPGSGGEFRAFHREKDDGLATLAWLRAQPWCDGRVAMAGASYLGFTAWAVAPYADPPLEALGLGVTASEFASSFYPGGALALHNTLIWSSLMGTQGDGTRPLHNRRVRRAMRHLPVGEADTAAIRRPEPFFQEVTAHAGSGGDFWKATDHSGGVPETTAPATMVTGWWDLFLRRQLRDFAALQAAGRDVRITIGPWGHDTKALRAMLIDQVSWLDAHLNGGKARLRQAPVRLHLQGADRWLDFDRWPPPGTKPTPLYLSRSLSWDVPADAERATFVYDPLDPTPSVGGPLLSPGKGGQRDNTRIERRHDVVVLTGAALERDLDIIGPVSATVHVRTNTGHGDLFLRLCDVDREGVSRNVTDGILRLTPDHATADGIVRAEIEMHPTAYRFRRGHRLRVMLAGGAFPRFARNPGTGEPAGEAVATRRTRFEVFRGATYPSAVHLPVRDGQA